MRYPCNNIYNEFIQQSPVPLRPKLSPKAFSKNGDQFIMVCDPSFPTISNCRYYQSLVNLNLQQRKSLAEKAKELGLATIPALNIDLSKLKQYKIEKVIENNIYRIKFSIAPNGNVRIMDKSINHDLWIKTGASTARATLKVFEHAFFGKWKIDVIVNSQKALILKLTRKVNSHHEIVLSGVIKKSKFDNGLEATVYLLHSDQLIDIGPLKLGGDFGFKISITGEWRLWETLGKYQLADVYVEWDKQSNIAENSLRLMHILVSKKDIALGGAAGAFAMISKWLLPLRPMVDNLFAELESLPVPPP